MFHPDMFRIDSSGYGCCGELPGGTLGLNDLAVKIIAILIIIVFTAVNLSRCKAGSSFPELHHGSQGNTAGADNIPRYLPETIQLT